MDYTTSKNSRIKKVIHFKKFLFFATLFSPGLLFAQTYTATNSVTVTAVVPSVVIQVPTPTPSAGGGGGGGTGGVPLTTQSGSDSAIFKGLAYPRSIVTLLKNGVILAEIPASPDGTFEIRVKNLNPGTYSFGIRAEDQDRLRSTLDLYTVYVAAAVTTIVDGIFIPPTITSDKLEVKRGDPIILTGKSVPNAKITLSIHSEKELVKKTVATNSGAWLYKLDSSELEIGDHESKVRAVTESDLSLFSDGLAFRVGKINRIRATSTTPTIIKTKSRCDLNSDGRVNLIDFSIMAFWYKRTGFPPQADFNVDGKINLTDFSIMAFCWTG